ncbi:MAG TPA: pilin [Candidatus Paceibacterota bacterium]|nr:pilin [Candidatus Paceibacterota bacterium]
MKKIITFIFLVTFFTIPTMLVFAQSTSTQAEGTSTGWHLTRGEGGCMEIELPFIPKCGATPASYLSGLYRLALGLGVLAALIMIVVAGITYATSGDNASKQKEARGQIKDAIIGMVILFASVLILNTVNPDIASMKLNVQFPAFSPTSFPTSTQKLTEVDKCIGSCSRDPCLKNFHVNLGQGVIDIPPEDSPLREKYDMCVDACRNYCQNKHR